MKYNNDNNKIKSYKNSILALLTIIYYTLFEKKPNADALCALEDVGFSKLYIVSLIYSALIIYYKTVTLPFTEQDVFDYLASEDFIQDLLNAQDYEYTLATFLENDNIVNFIVSSLKILSKETAEEVMIIDTSRNIYTESESYNIGNKTYRFVLHEHDAHRAGKHYDLRIELKDNYVISIAFRYNPFLKDKALGFIQPIHTSKWINFQGEIKEGYGAGTLKIVAKGTCTIFKSDNSFVIKFRDVKDAKIYQLAFIKNTNMSDNMNAIFATHTNKVYINYAKLNEIIDYFKPTEEKEMIDV